jgi:hypothetical protein
MNEYLSSISSSLSAWRHQSYMVSNDFYTDHVRNLDEGAKGDVRVWLQHARISFAFVGTEFMLNPKRLTSYSYNEEVLF